MAKISSANVFTELHHTLNENLPILKGEDASKESRMAAAHALLDDVTTVKDLFTARFSELLTEEKTGSAHAGTALSYQRMVSGLLITAGVPEALQSIVDFTSSYKSELNKELHASSENKDDLRSTVKEANHLKWAAVVLKDSIKAGAQVGIKKPSVLDLEPRGIFKLTDAYAPA